MAANKTTYTRCESDVRDVGALRQLQRRCGPRERYTSEAAPPVGHSRKLGKGAPHCATQLSAIVVTQLWPSASAAAAASRSSMSAAAASAGIAVAVTVGLGVEQRGVPSRACVGKVGVLSTQVNPDSWMLTERTTAG